MKYLLLMVCLISSCAMAMHHRHTRSTLKLHPIISYQKLTTRTAFDTVRASFLTVSGAALTTFGGWLTIAALRDVQHAFNNPHNNTSFVMDAIIEAAASAYCIVTGIDTMHDQLSKKHLVALSMLVGVIYAHLHSGI